jgi:hypothetical protein
VNRLDSPTLDRCETVLSATAQIDCGYRNASDRMVILRCCGPTEFYLERVVFPFELLSFRCPPESEVEIWTHGLGGPELLETVHAAGLQLEESASITPLEGFFHEEQNPWWLQAS